MESKRIAIWPYEKGGACGIVCVALQGGVLVQCFGATSCRTMVLAQPRPNNTHGNNHRTPEHKVALCGLSSSVGRSP